MRKLSHKIRNKTQITPIQYSTQIINQCNQAKERNKNDMCRKGRSPSFLADDITLYIEDLKYSTERFLVLITKFSHLARYKINMQKSIALLYAKNEFIKKQIKKSILS